MNLDFYSPYKEDEKSVLFIVTSSLEVLAQAIEEYSSHVEEDAKKCYEVTEETPNKCIMISFEKFGVIYAKNHTAEKPTIRLRLTPMEFAMVAHKYHITLEDSFVIDAEQDNIDEIRGKLIKKFEKDLTDHGIDPTKYTSKIKDLAEEYKKGNMSLNEVFRKIEEVAFELAKERFSKR